MDNNQFPNYDGQAPDAGVTQPVDNMNYNRTNYNQQGNPSQSQDFNQTGYPNQPQTGFNQSGYPNQPQTGFNQSGYPSQPQTGFNQSGYPNQPQTGFNQSGYPSQPQTGFNQTGYPTQPQTGFNQSGYPNQPQTGFNQAGYPAQPQTGFNQTGYPTQPQTGFNQSGYNMQGYGQPKPKKSLSKGAKIAIISTISLAVILAVVLVFIFWPKTGAKTKEEAAEEFLMAWASYDADEMIKYSLPKNAQDKAYKYTKEEYSYYFSDISNLIEAYQKAYFGRYYDSSDKVQVRNISVRDEDDYYYSNKEIKEDIEEFFQDDLGVDIEIQAACEVRVNFEYMDTDYYGDWDDEYEYFYMYKVKNRWYVFPEDVLD